MPEQRSFKPWDEALTMPIRQVPPTPQQRSSRRRTIRWISLGALAVVTLLMVLEVSISKSSTSETPAAPTTTPLGCGVSQVANGTQVDDPNCTELTLIANVCHANTSNWYKQSTPAVGQFFVMWFGANQTLQARFVYQIDANAHVTSAVIAFTDAAATRWLRTEDGKLHIVEDTFEFPDVEERLVDRLVPLRNPIE